MSHGRRACACTTLLFLSLFPIGAEAPPTVSSIGKTRLPSGSETLTSAVHQFRRERETDATHTGVVDIRGQKLSGHSWYCGAISTNYSWNVSRFPGDTYPISLRVQVREDVNTLEVIGDISGPFLVMRCGTD